MLWLILSSTILHCVLLINANGLYSVVAPKTLRSNSAYKVVVAIHNAPRPTEVSVSLTGPSFNSRKYVDVPSMSSKSIRFDIPKLTRGEYELKVLGSGGIEFQNSTKLGFEPELNWLYIQSDKATYKPGDKIQFRVLFLDKHTRPAVIDKPIQIEIRDGAQNLIKSWKDIKPTRGVYSGELQLSDRPVLGNWTLTAAAQDEGNVTNVLVVDKYVVPKFEKPVKGHVVASIEGSSTEKSLPIDGEVNVEFPISATAKRLLKITAIVTEELTDLKHNGTAYVTVHQHRHKQEDLLWPTHYRPGVLYEFKTVVRNLDGSPVMDSSKMVNFNVLCCQAYRNFSASLQNSIATQHIMLPDSTCKSCLVTSTFETAAKLERYIYKIDKKLMISIITKKWLLYQSCVGANGEYIIRKTVPDTLTSWVITGFSLSPQSGLAVTRSPSRIRVFQPFFITTNLPYSVKRGEVIAIPVVVFNYLGVDVKAKVSMDNSDGQYEFIETTNANMSQYHLGVQREKTLWIPANTGRGISFMIRPKKMGLTTLKITAISSYAGDRLHQILKVEADGVQKYVNKAVLINVQRLKRRSLAPPEKSLFIEKVDEAIEGSEFFEFEVFGSSQAPQLEHLDDLVHLPCGCGEQNMFNFVPSILALSYLKENNRQDQEIEKNAKSYVETGYQRELNYKRHDGSFSAWGQSDSSGSTWLTAYVIRSFHQAAKYIDIDKNVLVAGLDFLVSRQGTHGNFRELGRVIHNSHGSPLALTSFVLLTFFENKEYMHKYQNVIDRAAAFVDTKVRQSNEPYDLAIAALALSLAGKRKANIALDKLERLASRRGDHKWWTGSDKSKSSDVEITSYVLLALLEHLEQHKSNEHRPIVDWLISKRNSNGGFVSSQDTVVGIMALTKFELQSHESTDSLNIDYWLSIKDKKHVTITKETEFKVQTHTLPENGNNLKFLATGQGHAQVQLSYRYNVATKEASPSFKLTTTVKKSDKSRLILGICGEYTPIAASDGNKPTNMALMQVQLPSGYVCDTDSFAAIEAISDVKRVETKNEDTEVHIYFEKLLPGDRKCLTLKAIYTHAVANLKPSWIRLYDYYATERTATEFYHVDTSLCDICHGDECGSGC
ncbi:GM17925 [Drosophila sechellia]|uniref:TEP1-F n=1 Tax=Drosophila sechellia TaxID=7238 RepID=B4I1X9_DROSE|nr:GM17925 [Drosophila sechellia]